VEEESLEEGIWREIRAVEGPTRQLTPRGRKAIIRYPFDRHVRGTLKRSFVIWGPVLQRRDEEGLGCCWEKHRALDRGKREHSNEETRKSIKSQEPFMLINPNQIWKEKSRWFYEGAAALRGDVSRLKSVGGKCVPSLRKGIVRKDVKKERINRKEPLVFDSKRGLKIRN